jgi:hypothetical protein
MQSTLLVRLAALALFAAVAFAQRKRALALPLHSRVQ